MRVCEVAGIAASGEFAPLTSRNIAKTRSADGRGGNVCKVTSINCQPIARRPSKHADAVAAGAIPTTIPTESRSGLFAAAVTPPRHDGVQFGPIHVWRLPGFREAGIQVARHSVVL